MAEGAGLLNQWALTRPEGSNPSPSAKVRTEMQLFDPTDIFGSFDLLNGFSLEEIAAIGTTSTFLRVLYLALCIVLVLGLFDRPNKGDNIFKPFMDMIKRYLGM